MEYEKSLSSHLPLVNEISDPQLQLVLGIISNKTIGIEN